MEVHVQAEVTAGRQIVRIDTGGMGLSFLRHQRSVVDRLRISSLLHVLSLIVNAARPWGRVQALTPDHRAAAFHRRLRCILSRCSDEDPLNVFELGRIKMHPFERLFPWR